MQLRLRIMSYADCCGTVTLEVKKETTIGEEIEVNFDDPNVLFEAGVWERPTGLYSFPIHEVNTFGDYAECQLAYDEPEPGDTGTSKDDY